MKLLRRSVPVVAICLTLLTFQGAAAPPSDPGPARDVYVVFLPEAPLAAYRGEVAGLKATNPRARGEKRLDPRSADSRAYLRHLDRSQARHITDMERSVGRSLEVIFRYRGGGNGIATRLTAQEAVRLEGLPGLRVVKDFDRPLDTDRGPVFIGAGGIWDGSATGGAPTQGEGVVVGVLDTGANSSHPSFSDAPVDGHVFTNPLGSGNFIGWCDPGDPNYYPAFPCNDKMIGAWDFADAVSVDNDGPEDNDGHGSHTASTSAGNHLDLTGDGLSDMSGVAPHANLIVYDVCYVDPGSGQGLCPFSATTAAVDQAILDGVVDAINYSISGGGNPWGGDIDTFFLNAVASGIFVAASAGNSGPGAATVAHRGPWVTTVAASTHDRITWEASVMNMSGGTAPPSDITGASRTGPYGPAPIVYAGNFVNGDANPEQCLSPFPPGTWTGGEIVVCDRGSIARVMKGQNVQDGGAAAFILANVAGGSTNTVADAHVIPGVHVSETDGNALRTWLASGTGHTATFSDSAVVLGGGDVIAGFSSRGPNTSFDVLKPDVTNPGVAIYAAVADGTLDEVGLPPFRGGEFSFLNGTSMSSPHTAGCGALIKALHPDWTPPEIKSALMTTALPFISGGPFDYGAGRVDLSQAGRAGIVFDETETNFLAANPGTGGDPQTLNLASFMESACDGACQWTRTVKSAASIPVEWTGSGTAPAGFSLSVQPAVFTLAPGATQTLTFEVSVDTGSPVASWTFGTFTLTPDAPGIPAAGMPVAFIPFKPNIVFDAHVMGDAEGNMDGILDPWEIATITVNLRNDGNTDATGIAGVLSTTTPGVTVLDAAAVWPDIPVGPLANLPPGFRVHVDGTVACGSFIDFQLDVTSDQGPFSMNFQQEVGVTGQPVVDAPSFDTPLVIPDNKVAGVVSSVGVSETFTINRVTVDVNITHPDIGDLEIDLTSPSGTTVRLHDRTGAGIANLAKTYNIVNPADGPGSLADFIGETMDGSWDLKVADRSNGDQGTLNSWTPHLRAPLMTLCSAISCFAVPQGSAAPPDVCGGDSTTLSGAGTFVTGSDCSGVVEYRFEDGGALLQDWSIDPDVIVTPSTPASYTVRVRDQGTLAEDSSTVPVGVQQPPTNMVTQIPAPLSPGGTDLLLNAGPGPATYLWRDDAAAVVGASQFLNLTQSSCGRTYTVEMATSAGCASMDAHTVTCVPPEVSAPVSTVPFRMGLDVAGTIEFELLPLPNVVYHLYHAGTIAEMLAGDWTNKYCDLAAGATGTWTPIDATTVQWTPAAPGDIFEGNWAVVAEIAPFEGSFGSQSSGSARPPDLDGLGSSGNFGCP